MFIRIIAIALSVSFTFLGCSISSPYQKGTIADAGPVPGTYVGPIHKGHTVPEMPPAQKSVVPELVSHGLRGKKQIALTFDACTTRDVSRYDNRVTQELIAANAPATIFLGGGWAESESAQVLALSKNPLFELGNHTFTHPHMKAISDEAIRQELLHTQAEIHLITGQQPTLFRPPYGEYDERVVRIAAELGLTTIEYDLPSGDPDQHATKERLVEWVLRKAEPGSIIVMHINHTRFHTAEALPGIINGLREKGYELVTVGELMKAMSPAERSD